MYADSQPVDVGMSLVLPVNLARFGTGYLAENPVAGVLLSLLAFFVLIAVLAVPISSLFGIDLFPGLVPHARSLGGSVNFSDMLESLTGSRTVQEFMDTPLEDFVRRVLRDDQREGRAMQTVGDLVGRAAEAATPVLSVLDYENAFAAVQVPGEECRHRLMCHVHTQVSKLPTLLQKAYSFVGPLMHHHQNYSRAILTGLSGGDCNEIFPACPYSALQMTAFVPFLRKGKHGNFL
ncbi:hypothetical protein O3P69_000020 [Scylla paramamosain]|uniref:Uncharacterized protein n=1 Tax=Scylla paramamosain TaxID=85552 RepID=A0AAW0UU26_SCYPA